MYESSKNQVVSVASLSAGVLAKTSSTTAPIHFQSCHIQSRHTTTCYYNNLRLQLRVRSRPLPRPESKIAGMVGTTICDGW